MKGNSYYYELIAKFTFRQAQLFPIRAAVRTGFPGRGNNYLFCHSERSEESLFDVSTENKQRQILRFAQTDKRFEFFRSLFSLSGLDFGQTQI